MGSPATQRASRASVGSTGLTESGPVWSTTSLKWLIQSSRPQCKSHKAKLTETCIHESNCAAADGVCKQFKSCFSKVRSLCKCESVKGCGCFLLASNRALGLKCGAKTPGFTLHFLPTLRSDWVREKRK